jgi:DeoR/GlpR family transcriptional regulator of sugar metabolism
MHRTSLPAGRQQHILRALEQDGFALVADMQDQLQVSEMTIRRDMQALEEAGLGRRVRGGLVANHIVVRTRGALTGNGDLMTKTQRYLQRTEQALRDGDLGLAARSVALVADLVEQMARQRAAWR